MRMLRSIAIFLSTNAIYHTAPLHNHKNDVILFVSSFLFKNPHPSKHKLNQITKQIGLFSSTDGDRFDSSSNNNAESNSNIGIEDLIIQKKIINQLFCFTSSVPSVTSSSSSSSMISMTFAGIGYINNASDDAKNDNKSKDKAIKCMFLTLPEYIQNKNDQSSFPAIAIPLLTNNNQWNEQALMNLLRSAYQNKPMSKSKCLSLNSIFINRDGALFDELPWSTWTVGNHTFDMAGNPIDAKYHFGKRDAFQRFMGKDWPGRSLSYGNLVQKLIYMLDGDMNDNSDSKKSKNSLSDEKLYQENMNILSKRIIELECQEIRAELAELEEQLAIMRNKEIANSFANDMRIDIENTIQEQQIQLEQKQKSFNDLENAFQKNSEELLRNPFSFKGLLEAVDRFSNKNNTSAPPYRGAYGFSPMIDSKIEMFEKSILPYTGPYDLLNDIIQEQLQANVIGLVLEDTWIMDERVLIGGACVLQRKRGKKTITIAGEVVEIFDDDEDDDNYLEDMDITGKEKNIKKSRVKGGEVYIAECDADEVIGLALATGSYIQIEKELWENMNVMVKAEETMTDDDDNNSQNEGKRFKKIEMLETNELNFQRANDGQNIKNEEMQEKISKLSPKTTASLFEGTDAFSSMDGDVQQQSNNANRNNIPITSLSQFDSLTNQEKARFLQSLDYLQQRSSNNDNAPSNKLPRPRVLRQSPNILTEMLLPFIDESIRRQYLIRQAMDNNDLDTANALSQSKSRRQLTRELAENSENDFEKDKWEKESDFYADLRADVTQDEGSYSRFLDKDDWYERDRLRIAKNVKKSDFGTLFDDI